jgi:hypothetical protein
MESVILERKEMLPEYALSATLKMKLKELLPAVIS